MAEATICGSEGGRFDLALAAVACAADVPAAPADDGEQGGGDGGDDGIEYKSMFVALLRDLLRSRRLGHKRHETELIARLKEDDAT